MTICNKVKVVLMGLSLVCALSKQNSKQARKKVSYCIVYNSFNYLCDLLGPVAFAKFSNIGNRDKLVVKVSCACCPRVSLLPSLSAMMVGQHSLVGGSVINMETINKPSADLEGVCPAHAP